jgi:hypothetical protein
LATRPPQNDVFMREVDEEVRRERMMEFGRKYGVWVGALIVLFFLVLGGSIWWRYHQEQVAGRQGETFQAALDDIGSGNVKKAQPPLDELAQSHDKGYRAMAEFTQADIALKNNDAKAAAAKFAAIAGDESLAQPFRDLALVRETALQFDSLKPQQVVDRLRPLAVKGNAFFGSAGEMVAIAYLQMNRRDLAAKMFGQIAQDDTTPDSLRQRAVQMAASLNQGADRQNEDKTAK